MKVHNDLNNLPSFRNAVVTIGSFDGVHSGHQKILEKVKLLAQSVEGESIVITFHPHPRQVIYPKDDTLRLITTIHEKVALLEKYGIDHVVVVPFTIEFSQQKADEYIQKFLVEKFHPKCIVIGYDHRFGLNRLGDINFLKWHSKSANFKVIEIAKQEVDDIGVSSSKIRKALEVGKIEAANKLLGHFFTLTGNVVRGQKIGTELGFPTANIQIPQSYKLIPADGIYAAFVWHKKHRYRAMLYIGTRPTLPHLSNRTVEVNIFDFHKDIYGDKLQIELVEWLRGDMHFDNLDGLRQQLKKDKTLSLEVLQTTENQLNEEISLKQKSVAIVILNYNGKALLEQFLPSVQATRYSNFKIYVADNGSTDGSLEWLQTHYKDIETINLHSNHGFAKGYNLALQQIHSEYYVLLNSDVEVTENWVTPIINMMEKNKTIGAVQPKILAQQSKESFEYAGAAGGYLDHWGYPFCRGRIFNTVEKDQGQYDSVEEIFWASGAALFVQAKLFHALGGFDERFFAHLEEIDWCWRLKRAGYRVMVCPQSVIYHVGGGTLNYQSPRKTYLNFRNSYFTLVKNETTQKLWWLIPWRLLLDAAAGLLFLIKGQFSHIRSIVQAHWDFFPVFRKIYRERADIQDKIDRISIRLEPNETGILKKSIVFQYYLKGKRYFWQL